MEHQEELVARLLPHDIHEPQHLLLASGIRVQEDGAVIIPPGGVDVQRGHVSSMQLTLPLLHLIPLVVSPVGRMNLAKGLHREEEDQLEVRHTALRRPAFQRCNEPFSWSHTPADLRIGLRGP